MMEGAPVVVVRVVCVGRLVLLARMRVLWGVIDIVVRSYSVVARQRASDAWVPPERTALAGRRALNRKNLKGGCPAGQRRERLGGLRGVGRKGEALRATRRWCL